MTDNVPDTLATSVIVPLVDMRAISKSYPGCLANDAIDLQLKAGRVHALLGENGAGKSTLVKILYGLLASDTGTIRWAGNLVHIDSPSAARALGIAMVFQHFSLFDSLSVLENIALGMDQDADNDLRQRIIEVSARYGLPLDPDRSVYTLSVGERQRIEIVRCLLQQPKLLIMDEPTSVLTPQEVADLFATLSRLAEEGVAILYISHKLEEIRQLCHEATILRGGRKVASANPQEESASSLAALMMGSDLPVARVAEVRKTGPVLFSMDNLTHQAGTTHGINLQGLTLQVAAGEIVGIAGVAGNGQDEFMQVISGESLLAAPNRLMLKNQPIGHINAAGRRRMGLCCVPEERLGHAAVPGLTLTENVFLTAHHTKALRHFGLISHRRSREFALEIIQRFNVQCHGAHSLASSLSGGNLQKFIVGREILQSPTVLVISQPTWGVDAGAAAAIHSAIRALAQQGAAVLLVSQDLDELMLVTDRIGALCAGQLSQMHRTADITVRQVGLLMGGEIAA